MPLTSVRPLLWSLAWLLKCPISSFAFMWGLLGACRGSVLWPLRHWKATVRSPQSLLFFWLKKHNSLSPSFLEKCSSSPFGWWPYLPFGATGPPWSIQFGKEMALSSSLGSSIVTEICWVLKYFYWFFILFKLVTVKKMKMWPEWQKRVSWR